MKKLLCLALMMTALFSPAALAENGYNAISPYGERDMWPVQQNGLWGFVDGNGTLIRPCEWEDVGMVVNGLAPVQKDGKWGVIDRNGKLIVPCEWTMVFVYEDGGFVVNDNGLAGALAADGTVLIPCGQYGSVGPVIGGVRQVRQGEAWGLCAGNGTLIVDCQWHSTGYFSEGLAWVDGQGGYRFGYVNGQGELVIPCVFSSASDFHSGSAAVRTDEGWQLIDTAGNFLCAQAYDNMEQFPTKDLILVEKDGKSGYINRQGEVAIPLIYDRAQAFGDGLALVQLGDDIFWIDETGAKALDRPEGYTSFPFDGGVAAIKNSDGLWGLMDRQGNFVTPCQWENILRYAFTVNGFACVTREGQEGFINKQGDLISGRLYSQGTVSCGMDGDRLFLLEDGVLSIYAADGVKVY